MPDTNARFTVTIENISEGAFSTLLSNGVYYTHRDGFPMFFTNSFDYGEGLENLAEDGRSDILLSNLIQKNEVLESGEFREFFSGESAVFTFVASYGDFFNFATMLTDSNDGFYAYDEEGIHLFEPGGEPLSGDITNGLHLWDAGTEANQTPYEGSFQPGRQSAENEGEETAEGVRLLNDAFSYPEVDQVIRVSISAEVL